LFYNSPFDPFKLAQPYYLAWPGLENIEMAQGVDFVSYVWLYLKIHDLRYVVVHHKPGDFPEFPVHLARLESLLAEAKIFEDADTAVFDRDRLPKPNSPVLLYAEGWGDRTFSESGRSCMLGKVAKVHVYNPDPDQPVAVGLEVSSNKHPRKVTMKAGGIELGSWVVQPGEKSLLSSPPFKIRSGFEVLTIESDGEETPSGHNLTALGFKTPFSLWATKVGVVSARIPQDIAKLPKPVETR
jgi:hypothetical protein